MKHISLLFCLFIMPLTALTQEVVIDTNYYAPPPVVRKRVLTEDPEQRSGNRRAEAVRRDRNRQELLEKLNEVKTWYIGGESGFRSDGSLLTNSFDGLVSNPTLTKTVWGLLAGYTYRNSWTIETGYTRSPIHLNITIANSGSPLVFNYQNSGYGIPIRLKRRIGSGSRAANGTGFWLTAGAWLVPNGEGQTGDFKLIGYSYRGRTRADTLRLTNTTTIANSITGIAELGIDYSTRLSSSLELGFFARKYWGLGTALQANLVYTVNTTARQQATITADGTGWGFGVSLRYIYGRQHELKTSGNQPHLYFR